MHMSNSIQVRDGGEATRDRQQPHTDDVALLQRVAAGDAEALGVLYDRYGRLVFTVALRITGDHGAAEEITQDTFLRLWERAAQYQSARGSFVSWLWTVVHRRSIDELRSRRWSTRQREVQLDDTIAATAWVDHTARIHLCIDLQQALAELPAIQRDVIEQTAFMGLSRQEVARQTASPAATIHTRWRKGLQRLRAMLDSAEGAHAVPGPMCLDRAS